MTRLWVRLLATAATFAAFTSSALAEPAAYQIDKNHSIIGFNVRHFFAKVPGRFNDFDAKLLIDDKNLAASSVDVTIQATSIDTKVEKRDNHLRSADFFDVANHPTLTFKSTKVVPGEGTSFKIEGDLTIRGVTKPVVLDVENLGIGAFGNAGKSADIRAGFEATTKINRKDFGVSWNRTFDQGGTMLSDDVWITLQIEAVKGEPKPEAAAAEKKPEATAVEKKPETAAAEKKASDKK